LKILILKPSSLGDVIHALPVLRLLKLQEPRAEIYWWLASGLTPLLEGDPDLAGIIPFARHQWKSPADWPALFSRIHEMRRHRFDLVIDLQGLARSGLFAWLADGSLTVGLDVQREGARGFHDISIPRPMPGTHAVDWYLAVLRVLGYASVGRFDWLPLRPAVAAAVRSKWPVAGHRWMVVNPGARWYNKRWPVEHYASLVRGLAEQHPELHFAVTGSTGERELGDAICRAAPGRCANLAGATTLWELIEWIRLAEVMVTNDTGPMHVAAALGRPVVAIFGPTDPQRTGPYGQVDSVLSEAVECAPCMKAKCHYPDPLACLTRIAPARVQAAVSGYLPRS
jgi:heptosyltransferase-1